LFRDATTCGTTPTFAGRIPRRSPGNRIGDYALPVAALANPQT